MVLLSVFLIILLVVIGLIVLLVLVMVVVVLLDVVVLTVNMLYLKKKIANKILLILIIKVVDVAKFTSSPGLSLDDLKREVDKNKD